jgi:adhesin transport system outer membrane protein
VDYSRKTFDAYLKQFSVSRRTLLDVLIVENDGFQSAVQLVTVSTNEIIAAYRILRLMGILQVSR